jgi:hypothetical protein
VVFQLGLKHSSGRESRLNCATTAMSSCKRFYGESIHCSYVVDYVVSSVATFALLIKYLLNRHFGVVI